LTPLCDANCENPPTARGSCSWVRIADQKAQTPDEPPRPDWAPTPPDPPSFVAAVHAARTKPPPGLGADPARPKGGV